MAGPHDPVPPLQLPDSTGAQSDRVIGAGVEAIVKTLEQIEADASQREPLRDHDGLACFDYLYTIITRNVLRCVTGTALVTDDPRFHDREFMAVFDIAFANRYLDAIGLGKQQSWQPKCWKVLLDHREASYISPLIFAVAGVNAHVNFDLPFALVTACAEMGREVDSGANHEDYELINQIFAEHMQELRQHFENRFAKGFDKAFVSKVENMVGNLVVVVARDLAWRRAKQLWRVHDDEAKMTKLAKSRDRWVALASWGLFELDHMPSMVFRAMYVVPGPTRRVAARGLARTGWDAKRQNAPSAHPKPPPLGR